MTLIFGMKLLDVSVDWKPLLNLLEISNKRQHCWEFLKEVPKKVQHAKVTSKSSKIFMYRFDKCYSRQKMMMKTKKIVININFGRTITKRVCEWWEMILGELKIDDRWWRMSQREQQQQQRQETICVCGDCNIQRFKVF